MVLEETKLGRTSSPRRSSVIRGTTLASLSFVVLMLCALYVLPRDLQAQTSTLTVEGGTISVTLPDAPMKASQEELLGWVRNAAEAVAIYYGQFPRPHVTLVVRASNGSGVHHGVTYAKDGGLIRISVGVEATADDLKADWVLAHEMTHLAFPSMPDDQHWIEEGLATYVEPVARARVGQLTQEDVWKQFIRFMPRGQPMAGDAGLDNTHTWGRTYWGGALFCLLADTEIRERTHNRKGLQDALRAILENGGDITKDWNIEQAFAAGDKATGTKVLEDLYQQMRDRPAPADLDTLWKDLGVSLAGGSLSFDDRAPEANIRKAITGPERKTVQRGEKE